MIKPGKQRELIDSIRDLTVVNGHAPTVREIADRMGTNLSNAHGHLSRARDKGLVTWEPHKSRTIRLMEVAHEQQA